MKEGHYIAKTFHGLEEVLVKELEELGASRIVPLKRAVKFSGDKELLYKANYWLRTALNVLVPIHEFKASNDQELYEGAKKFPWTDLFGLRNTFSVHATVYSTKFNHSQYVALKIKDAIADSFTEKMGKRPNVDPKNSHIKINVHLSETHCSLSLDSSGQALFKRGYRTDQWKAPLNEAVAAGILLIAGYDGSTALLDPMCGSGTFSFEAALIAAGMPSGQARKHYGFMKWQDYEPKLWEKIKEEAFDKRKLILNQIVGFDIAGGAVNAANTNLNYFPSKRNLRFFRDDFLHYVPRQHEGIVVINPPYDRRIGHMDIEQFYQNMGDRLKQSYEGWDAWIMSENQEAMKSVGLKPSKKLTLYNGPLKCQLHKYELYSGSRKVTSETPKFEDGQDPPRATKRPRITVGKEKTEVPEAKETKIPDPIEAQESIETKKPVETPEPVKAPESIEKKEPTVDQNDTKGTKRTENEDGGAPLRYTRRDS